MPGSTIWKGHIHFGETDVAVKLHSAVRVERIQFNLLHARDHARLLQQMICAYEKKPVPAEEQTKGLEIEDGKYVVVDPKDLEAFVPESSRMIAVHEFVKTEEVDPMFLERTYNLEPDGSGEAVKYSALATNLDAMGVVGICTWSMRKRSYFGAIQGSGDTLRLNVFRYADEVISPKSLDLESVALSEKELKAGRELINQLTETFDPKKFKDEHQQKLQAMIDKKARGEKIAILAPRRQKVTDPDELLKVLEASLKKAA